MKITDDVIIDLIPVYQSGEASEDTQALVETYFQENPAFAQMITQIENKLNVLSTSDITIAQEKEAIMRVKKILRWRSILFGIALFCSLMPLSAAGNSEDGLTWMMIRDLPILAAGFIFFAMISWGAYYWTFRALPDTQ